MDKGMQRPAVRNIAERLRCRSAQSAIRPALRVLSHYCRVWSFVKDKDVPLRVRIAFLLRSSRFFLFYRDHIRLCGSDVYANYLVPSGTYDLFPHLSRRYYLSKDLGLRERVQCMLFHFRHEEASFNAGYKQQVYSEGGMVLWEKIVDGASFKIRLTLADRYAAEGDLSVSLTVDGERLHSISFSWVTGNLAGGAPVGIFIAANQGRWRKDHEYHDKFNAAFPQNAPNFFCYAALQGLAHAVGAPEMRAVSSRLQVCYVSEDIKHFDNAYESFWETVGGIAEPSGGYILPVPQPVKPLSEVPAKHRKRAANRRAMLNEISEGALRVVAAHFRGVPLQRAENSFS
jgi:uncharacterized protein VirK/YbjX